MKLKDYLSERGITAVAFAAQIGVSPSTVSRLCAETIWPDHDTAHAIYSATNQSVGPQDFLRPLASKDAQGAAAE